ncbi:MAG: zinc-binding dehydrogenase [Oscillospiraceae bacterium]
MEKMKAVIYNGIGDVEVREIEKPTVKENDVLVKVVRAGICGTDVNAYKFGGAVSGIDDGSEFGHEMVGYICELGSKADPELKEGMRVFVHPQFCSHLGAAHSCMAGAFSEYVLVENAKLEYNLFELPESASYDEAVVTEPFSVGTHGANTSRAKIGEKVVVFGAGTIGLCAAACLLAKGIKDVVVSDVVDWRLDKAKAIGAIPFNSAKGDLGEFLMDKYGYDLIGFGTKAAKVDAYIDAAGAPSVLQDFLNIANTGSRMAVVAMYHNMVQIQPTNILLSECEILGSCAYNNKDIHEVLDNLGSKRTKITEIITDHFKLDDAKEAFAVAADSSRSLKVVIDFD